MNPRTILLIIALALFIAAAVRERSLVAAGLAAVTITQIP